MFRPELVAHRGHPARFPENSLAGISSAVTLGARWIEIDAQLSSDGVAVVFHDPTLSRTCGVEGNIFDTTLEELRGLRLSHPDGAEDFEAGIPTLRAVATVLAAHPEVTTFVEIKPHSVERFGRAAVLDAVRDVLRPIRRQTVVISYLPEIVSDSRIAGWPRVGLILKNWDQRTDSAIRDLEPEFVFCNVKKLPTEGDLTLERSSLAVYDITDPGQALTLASRGVELIETFAIGEMLRALGGHAGDPS